MTLCAKGAQKREISRRGLALLPCATPHTTFLTVVLAHCMPAQTVVT